MKRKNNSYGIAALSSHHVRFLLLLVLVLTMLPAGCQNGLIYNDLNIQEGIIDGIAVSETQQEDLILSLLGKTFDEIKQVMGEPDEQGFEDWLGANHYMLYRVEKGFIRFCSPEYNENKIAVSIFLGEGMAVLGAKVGMNFQEIADILGTPDLGPEIGMDNFYYADYFRSGTNHDVSDIFISFVAYSIDSSTKYALVKWETFTEEETEILQIKK